MLPQQIERYKRIRPGMITDNGQDVCSNHLYTTNTTNSPRRK
jgi:hypothetical protein